MMNQRAFGLVLTVLCASICPLSAQNFTQTGSTNEARVVHTATLLDNGTVLVTGGPSNTAEIYNPQTGTWRYTLHPMNYARTGHTAVKLGDGRVLIAGGTALAQELRGDSLLSAGIQARTFTFYDEDQYVGNYPGLGPPPNCFIEILPVPRDPACLAPLTDNYHQIAQTWIDAVAPTPDDHIVVIGHSYGGNRARLLLNNWRTGGTRLTV